VGLLGELYDVREEALSALIEPFFVLIVWCEIDSQLELLADYSLGDDALTAYEGPLDSKEGS
jgi:hypothetical protein